MERKGTILCDSMIFTVSTMWITIFVVIATISDELVIMLLILSIHIIYILNGF